MLEAVLFDWGNTLVHFEWDDARVVSAHRAALGRDDPEFTARWRELLLGDTHGHRPYAELLGELGVGDPEGFIEREHGAWRDALSVLAAAPALLESLRDGGLKTGVVGNSWPDPARLLHEDAERLGLAPLLDTMVFSDEAGARKPSPEPFLMACGRLDVDPTATLFVGDDLVNDVQGAKSVGMGTVQALWFRADDTPGIEADFQAFTAMDVLNIARRLVAA
ncbi:MAG TPA: HAD family hydrolase [Gaiellaceae bacterium]|nr:HAD family hydrolase [Gaiellaceae bacterium]